MSYKNLDLWGALLSAIKTYWPQIFGAILATLIAYARIVYDGEKGRDGEWVEGILCGLLTLAMTSVLTFVGLPVEISPAIGGGIGFLGVKRIRRIALRELKKRTGVDGE